MPRGTFNTKFDPKLTAYNFSEEEQEKIKIVLRKLYDDLRKLDGEIKK